METHINVKITNCEVNTAIKSLKNNRSPGYDNIVAEMMKILSSPTIDKLTHIINTTINNKQPHQLELGLSKSDQTTSEKTQNKLGMLLDTKQEWKRRKQLTTKAMLMLSKIWNSSITRNKKIRIYKAYVQSIMLFGCSTWAWTRRCLGRWKVLTEEWCSMHGGFFGQTVNAMVEPASQVVTRRRWHMFAHILRMDDLVPAKQTTIKCLKEKTQSTILLLTIKHDLEAHRLDIDQAVELAQDRYLWKLEKSHTLANEDF